MTETEKLLDAALDLARRKFENPSERTVMDLWDELRQEHERRVWEEAPAAHATVH